MDGLQLPEGLVTKPINTERLLETVKVIIGGESATAIK
jgi:hypothetical protein